jgi:drug/metabolite transporter superfamily protein YnfA
VLTDVAVALMWLRSVDGVRPSVWDGMGAAVTLAGMAIIAYQPRHERRLFGETALRMAR